MSWRRSYPDLAGALLQAGGDLGDGEPLREVEVLQDRLGRYPSGLDGPATPETAPSGGPTVDGRLPLVDRRRSATRPAVDSRLHGPILPNVAPAAN